MPKIDKLGELDWGGDPQFSHLLPVEEAFHLAEAVRRKSNLSQQQLATYRLASPVLYIGDQYELDLIVRLDEQWHGQHRQEWVTFAPNGSVTAEVCFHKRYQEEDCRPISMSELHLPLSFMAGLSQIREKYACQIILGWV